MSSRDSSGATYWVELISACVALYPWKRSSALEHSPFPMVLDPYKTWPGTDVLSSLLEVIVEQS